MSSYAKHHRLQSSGANRLSFRRQDLIDQRGRLESGIGRADGGLFCYVGLEDRVPANHPLRVIRRIVTDVLAALDGAAPTITCCTADIGLGVNLDNFVGLLPVR
jgi:hypothetical protein